MWVLFFIMIYTNDKHMKTLYSLLTESTDSLTPLTRVLCAASNFRRTDLEGLPKRDLGKLVDYIKSTCKSAKQITDYACLEDLFKAGRGAIKIQLTDKTKIGDVYLYVNDCELHYCMSFAYCQKKFSPGFTKFYGGDAQNMSFEAKADDIIKLIKNTPIPTGRALFAEHDEFIADIKQLLGITVKTIEVS